MVAVVGWWVVGVEVVEVGFLGWNVSRHSSRSVSELFVLLPAFEESRKSILGKVRCQEGKACTYTQ